jgi:hypothetical protein
MSSVRPLAATPTTYSTPSGPGSRRAASVGSSCSRSNGRLGELTRAERGATAAILIEAVAVAAIAVLLVGGIASVYSPSWKPGVSTVVDLSKSVGQFVAVCAFWLLIAGAVGALVAVVLGGL